MTETQISKSIAEYLDKAGIFNLRLQSGRVRKGSATIQLCKKGTPDRFCLFKDLGAVFLEIKKPNEKPSDEQQNVHHEILRSGGKVIVATSLDDFLNQLTQLRRVF